MRVEDFIKEGSDCSVGISKQSGRLMDGVMCWGGGVAGNADGRGKSD